MNTVFGAVFGRRCEVCETDDDLICCADPDVQRSGPAMNEDIGKRFLDAHVHAAHKSQTMDEEYGDGSNHECCLHCGFCRTCEDCRVYGCGTTDGKTGTLERRQ